LLRLLRSHGEYRESAALNEGMNGFTLLPSGDLVHHEVGFVIATRSPMLERSIRMPASLMASCMLPAQHSLELHNWQERQSSCLA